jgi:hypothetical protein
VEVTAQGGVKIEWQHYGIPAFVLIEYSFPDGEVVVIVSLIQTTSGVLQEVVTLTEQLQES